jgi:yecA family protein
MRAQARAHEIPLDHVDLEVLDRFLTSDRSPPESMMLSDLDGFLTGIAVGPELVMPSEWLLVIWGGDAAEFADEAEAKAILGTIMGRYNEILRQIANDDLDPVFWADRGGTVIAADWAEGFLQAIMLRADAWEPLFKSKRDGQLLIPILALCGDENGESLLACRPRRKIASWKRPLSSSLPVSPQSPPIGAQKDQHKSRCPCCMAGRPNTTTRPPRSAATSHAHAALEKSSKNAAAKQPKQKPRLTAAFTGCVRGGTNCGFTTFEQCMETARGLGSFCQPNTQYVPPPGPHPLSRVYRRYPY